MLSGFFSKYFSDERSEFLKQIQQIKIRINESSMTAVKKRIFGILLDYAATNNNNTILNMITGDNDLARKKLFLSRVISLSYASDDSLIQEIEKLINELEYENELRAKLVAEIGGIKSDLQVSRQKAHQLSYSLAAIGSLLLFCNKPMLGTIVAAFEISMLLIKDVKPYINEVYELYESGILFNAIVDGPTSAREDLAANTFQIKPRK